MISVTTNINVVVGGLNAKLKAAGVEGGIFKDKMIRAIASSVGGYVKRRVHQEGLNSSGTPIGSYSAQYLKRRQAKYNRTSDTKVIFSLTRQMENDFSVVAANPIKTSTGYGLGFKSNAVYSSKVSNADTEEGLRKALNKKTKKGKTTIRTISNGQKAQWLQYDGVGRNKKVFGPVYKLTDKEKVFVKTLAQGYADQFIRDLG